MDNKKQTLEELAALDPAAPAKKALVGIDGFVDKIVHPVDQRSGPGDQFTPISTISEFGARISSAAGKSANIELAPVVDKLGGNGPIMANAQSSLGIDVRYVGALGEKAIHPVFEDFAEKTRAVSLADPGVTHAAEFNDGKIMFGSMASLDNICYETILQTMGQEALAEAFAGSDSIAMVNWTMIPYLSDVFRQFLGKLLPSLPETRSAFSFSTWPTRKNAPARTSAKCSAYSANSSSSEKSSSA